MVHNGVEQGMMSLLCEILGIMTGQLNMSHEEVPVGFDQWNKSWPLHDKFLVSIAVDICRTRNDNG